jgi:hypothetical protein
MPIPSRSTWVDFLERDDAGEQLTTHLRAIADANPLLKSIIDRVDFNATLPRQGAAQGALQGVQIEMLYKRTYELVQAHRDRSCRIRGGPVQSRSAVGTKD